eukprot:scaffold53409_cov59-Attheya_sp.AAC.1
MMRRFNIEYDRVSGDTLELLTGRCRLVANAITRIIRNGQTENSQEQGGLRSTKQNETKENEDVILESIKEVQDALSNSMKERLSEDPGSRALVENLLVGTLLNEPKKYSDLTSAEQEWADKSLVLVSGESQYVELNEPILVRAVRAAFKDKWDPVSW